MLEYFPDPYPGEILYSVWSRFSDDVCYSEKKDVMGELFGKINAVPMVDLPCFLGHFVNNLPFGHTYTLDYLINNHTLFPFYAPFLPRDRLCRLREQMISNKAVSIHKLIGNLGNATSTMSSPSWLRFCPTCVEKDRARYGECYWHRLHQIRGVEVCPKHKTFLENSAVPTRNYMTLESRQFVSAERSIPLCSPQLVASSSVNNVLMIIANTASYLLEHMHLPADDYFLHRQYHALLAQRGLMTLNGLVRTGDLLQAFADFYLPEILDLLHCENKQTREIRNWLSTLLRTSGRVRHPLNHILVINFLGSTIDAFLTQEIPYLQPFGVGSWPCLNPVCEHYLEPSLKKCQISEDSGKGRITGKFTCDCGFIYSRSGPDNSPEDQYRRDKILAYGPLWEAKLRELWFDSEIKLENIANQLGVVSNTVNQQAAKLSLPVPRVSLWTPRSGVKHKRSKAKDRSWYRSQWLALLSEAPGEGISALRKKLPGVHWWLRTHDIQWLLAHRPLSRPMQKSKNQFPVSLRFHQEFSCDEQTASWDEQIATSVRKCAKRITNATDYPKKVTMRKLYIEVPELRWIRQKKAPLTKLALQEVLETPEMFALRRIQWLVQKCREERIVLKRRQFLQKINIDHVLHIPSVRDAYEEAMSIITSIE
jgi:Tn7-like transposition protein D/TniQ